MTENDVSGWAPAYRGKKVLVSGAAGYLGCALAAALSRVECRLVLSARNFWQEYLPVGKAAEVSTVESNMSLPTPWGDELDGVEVIFHLAAYEHKHGSSFNPLLDLEVNARAVLSLLEACRKRGMHTRVVFASTSNLAGLPGSLPVDEPTPDQPLPMFAIHKLMAEKYLQYYARVFAMPAVVLRLANVYGAVPDRSVNGRVVINRMILKALKGEPLALFKNHACKRDFLFVGDAVNAFLAAGVQPVNVNGQPYVIGSGEGITISDAVHCIAESVAAFSGRAVQVRLNADVDIEEVEWRDFVANSARFQKAAGWQARVAFQSGVERTIEEFL